MDTKKAINLAARRLGILFFISLASVFAISEAAFLVLKEDSDRAPKEVQLVIPIGTAERIAAGEEVPSIPETMTFVLGDTLVIKNQDVADHQLGPLWVPAGTTASLVMGQADKLAFSCSFQPTRYLGIDVKKPTTWGTRLIALALATPALTLFIFVYSILIWPLKPREKGAEEPMALAGEANLSEP